MFENLSNRLEKAFKTLKGQGQITEGEQKLLVKARSGDINFTKGEIQTILNVAERAAKSQYDQSNKLLKSASTQSPTAQMFLDNVQKLPTEAPPAPSPNKMHVLRSFQSTIFENFSLPITKTFLYVLVSINCLAVTNV